MTAMRTGQRPRSKLRRPLVFVWRSAPGWTVVNLGLVLVQGVMQVGQSALSLLGIASLLLSFHWGIGAALVVAAIPGVFARWKFSRRMYAWQKQRTPAERQAWYFDWLLTRDLHAKEIRLFDLGALFMGRFRDLRRLLRREKLEI